MACDHVGENVSPSMLAMDIPLDVALRYCSSLYQKKTCCWTWLSKTGAIDENSVVNKMLTSKTCTNQSAEFKEKTCTPSWWPYMLKMSMMKKCVDILDVISC